MYHTVTITQLDTESYAVTATGSDDILMECVETISFENEAVGVTISDELELTAANQQIIIDVVSFDGYDEAQISFTGDSNE